MPPTMWCHRLPSACNSTQSSLLHVPRLLHVRRRNACSLPPRRRPNLATPPRCVGGGRTDDAPTLTTTTTPLGTITVRRITPADAGGAAVLVARAFAAAGSAPLGDVSSFIARCLLEAADADDAPVGLVADLAAPSGEGGAGTAPPFPFPPGRSTVVVGFAAVAGPGRAAVDRAAADGGASPSALPPGAAVLTNVAVDPRARRCGVGKALVAGAEAAARAEGAAGLWLEPRPGAGGAAARALYAACGYERAVVEAGGGAAAGDSGLGALFGRLVRATKRTPELLVKRF